MNYTNTMARLHAKLSIVAIMLGECFPTRHRSISHGISAATGNMGTWAPAAAMATHSKSRVVDGGTEFKKKKRKKKKRNNETP
jgi:hypothetical protein